MRDGFLEIRILKPQLSMQVSLHVLRTRFMGFFRNNQLFGSMTVVEEKLLGRWGSFALPPSM